MSILLLLLIGVLHGHAFAARIQRPNVVIVIGDQLRYESCGYADDANAITPNIDQLAADGISFDNYVVNTPMCAASRATLWTGKYASTHGMVVNELRLNPNHDTLGHLLTAKGYSCDYIGKWHLWANQARRHQATDDAFCPPGPCRLGFDGFWAAYNSHRGKFEAFSFNDTRERHEISEWGPKHFTELAIDRIKHHADGDQPFAMVVSYGLPHDLQDPHVDREIGSEQWLKRWGPNFPEHMRVYYAMAAGLDEQVGRLLRSLDDAGLAKNTIVMFTSAHGEQLGANERVFRMTFRDDSVRVPMLIRWPGKIPAGRKSRACMSAVDVMPTICGMLGVGFPDSVDGVDISDATRVDCSCEPDFALLQGMGHTFQWQDGFEWRAIRDQQFTYARSLADDAEFLFDNKNDPEQATNLADDPNYESDRDRLRQWLNEKLLATHDDFQPCTWYRDHWTDNRVILRGANGVFHREMGEDVRVDVRLLPVGKSAAVKSGQP